MFWFQKKQKQAGLPIPGKFVLSADEPLQTRRAQAVEKTLSGEILGVCNASPEIVACYLLDARNPNTEETGLIIALTVDEPQQMEEVAGRFQAMLRKFPEQAEKTVVMASGAFLPAHAGAEFYKRSEVQNPSLPKPPVDLNTPVENPRLAAAMSAFAHSRGRTTQDELTHALRTANFLVPILTDEMHTTSSGEGGKMTIQAGSLIKIVSCSDAGGGNHLALFTDWASIRAWTAQPVSTLVMPAAEAFEFALSDQYAGAVVNPGNNALPLDKKLLLYLRESDSAGA